MKTNSKTVLTIVFFLSLSVIFLACGPKSHMKISGPEKEVTSLEIEGYGSDVARESRKITKEQTLESLYNQLAKASTEEERDGIIKAIVVIEGRTEVPWRYKSSATNGSSNLPAGSRERKNLNRDRLRASQWKVQQ